GSLVGTGLGQLAVRSPPNARRAEAIPAPAAVGGDRMVVVEPRREVGGRLLPTLRPEAGTGVVEPDHRIRRMPPHENGGAVLSTDGHDPRGRTLPFQQIADGGGEQPVRRRLVRRTGPRFRLDGEYPPPRGEVVPAVAHDAVDGGSDARCE